MRRFDIGAGGRGMLNLYLAARASIEIPADVETNLAAFLEAKGLVGPQLPSGEFPPGPEVRWLFSQEAHDALLPAELTFDALSIERSPRPRFLPEAVEAFEDAECTVCGDPLDPDGLADELARLSLFSVERFALTCPSCRTELSLKEIDFGQPTEVSCFWLFIEGAGTTRLAPKVLERLSKLVGTPLVQVPEVIDSEGEAWVPPPTRRGGRGRRRGRD